MRRIAATILCMLIFVVLLCPGAYAASGDTIVYITSSGEKYHNLGCRHLSKSCIETTLQAAVNSGYTPCKVCHPPTLDVAAASTLPPSPTYTPAPTVSLEPLPTPVPTPVPTRAPTPTPARSDTQASVAATASGDDSNDGLTLITEAAIIGAVVYKVRKKRKAKK